MHIFGTVFNQFEAAKIAGISAGVRREKAIQNRLHAKNGVSVSVSQGRLCGRSSKALQAILLAFRMYRLAGISGAESK
jgi:hypothetical protein